MNVGSLLLRAARHRPGAPAVRHGARTLTYAELADRALRLAGALHGAGLRPGDRVALLQRNEPALVESLYGALLAGLVVVPINARLHPQEVSGIVEDADAAALLHGPEFAEAAALAPAPLRVETGPAYEQLLAASEPLPCAVARAPDELAWLFYTSGTTGRPKGAMWTHRVARVLVMNHLADLCAFRQDDVVLHAAPLTHGSGAVLLSSIARGCTNVVLTGASFDAGNFFETVERERVTCVAFLAPTQIVELLGSFDPQRDLSSLRSIVYGGGPMYAEHVKAALATFGPILTQLYGQGEAPNTITRLSAEDHVAFAATGDPRLTSAGVARTDVEVIVADDAGNELPSGTPGEILVRGDVVMSGYWRDPENTAATLVDGWLRTGDVGAFDEHGYLSILDRSKDLIVTGGTNVYPREVEDAISTLPGVREVAVVGVPDDYWGEAVHAVIVAAPGATLDAPTVIEHCRERIASYKKPRSVEFVDALPKNPTGKVLKRELRDAYWAARDRRVGGGALTRAAP